MSADLALQIALRARLVATPAVTTLVPAANILDRHARPNPSPSIILGDSMEMDPGTSLTRRHTRVIHTLHVWQEAPSTEGVKLIVAAIRAAIRAGRVTLTDGWHCADLSFVSARYLRDPDGKTTHGVVTVEGVLDGGPL